jgi:hypothetical protein
VTEVEVRAMLEKATGFEPNVEGRFMIHVRHLLVSGENGRVRLRFRRPIGATGCAHRNRSTDDTQICWHHR